MESNLQSTLSINCSALWLTKTWKNWQCSSKDPGYTFSNQIRHYPTALGFKFQIALTWNGTERHLCKLCGLAWAGGNTNCSRQAAEQVQHSLSSAGFVGRRWRNPGEIHQTALSLLSHPFTPTLRVLGRAQQLPTTFLRAQKSLLDFSY